MQISNIQILKPAASINFKTTGLPAHVICSPSVTIYPIKGLENRLSLLNCSHNTTIHNTVYNVRSKISLTVVVHAAVQFKLFSYQKSYYSAILCKLLCTIAGSGIKKARYR